jgi:hypothetical protein
MKACWQSSIRTVLFSKNSYKFPVITMNPLSPHSVLYWSYIFYVKWGRHRKGTSRNRGLMNWTAERSFKEDWKYIQQFQQPAKFNQEKSYYIFQSEIIIFRRSTPYITVSVLLSHYGLIRIQSVSMCAESHTVDKGLFPKLSSMWVKSLLKLLCYDLFYYFSVYI